MVSRVGFWAVVVVFVFNRPINSVALPRPRRHHLVHR